MQTRAIMHGIVDKSHELRLCTTWIAHDQNVDVRTVALGFDGGVTTNHHGQYSFLNPIMARNLWSNRLCEQLE